MEDECYPPMLSLEILFFEVWMNAFDLLLLEERFILAAVYGLLLRFEFVRAGCTLV